MNAEKEKLTRGTNKVPSAMTSKEIYSESDAIREIFTWSLDRPAWQRDALRRIVMQGELSNEDIDDLTDLCKDATLGNEPLTEQHFSGMRTGAPAVALQNIRCVQNVNALAGNQTLNLVPKGVTIIYGDNGAGKSGYVRILKDACRARTVRGRKEEILPNIYDAELRTQQAELEYLAGAQTQKAQWKNGEPTDELLSEISVFDSRTANVHVEETNDLAYTPYPMKLLERLVVACKAVKSRIEGEIASVKALSPRSIVDPACSTDTETGKLIRSLSKETNDKRVIALAKLSSTEIARLAELNSNFSHNQKAEARRINAQKDRLKRLYKRLEILSKSISVDSAQELSVLAADLSTKSNAAKLAAQDLSKDEPLPNVGTDIWRKMWEAARAFSLQNAYPGIDFPNVGEDAHCVLCQQRLDKDAEARLSRFDLFVQDRTQQEEANAKQNVVQLRSQMGSHSLTCSELQTEYKFISDEIGNSELATAVRNFLVRAKWRLRAILNSNADVANKEPILEDTGLNDAINALSTRAIVLLSDDESDVRKKLRAELAELKDRQWLAGLKGDVIAEIGRLSTIRDLETALADTKHASITSKISSLSESLITERLRARFAREISHFNLDSLAIELKRARSQDGVSRFQVKLIQSASSNAGDVLSEGEFRCVALGSFMAELATNNSGSGIVFDDPVSSLDHLHREAIAKRLALEGRSRQVIVFTHDLPFLFLLRNACTQVNTPAERTEVALRHVQKLLDIPGHCRNEGPDKAQDALSRLKTMRKHLGNTRIQYDQNPDGAAWLITARGLINSLRQTWETAIEDTISPVLRTFSSKVDTKGFAKLSAITQADAEVMRKHYGECSVLLHKVSDAINPSAPKPDLIEVELDALESWLLEVADRQRSIQIA